MAACMATCPRCGGTGDAPSPEGWPKWMQYNPTPRGDGTFVCDFCQGKGKVGNAEVWFATSVEHSDDCPHIPLPEDGSVLERELAAQFDQAPPC